MRKSIILLAVVALLIAGSYVVFGKEHMDGAGQKGKAMIGMCPQCAMMGKCMTYKQVVATQDGGVVVIVGNTLMKYDKDLNMVKEAEIKVDMEKMQKQMQEMMSKCPMCQNMKKMEKAMPEMNMDMENDN